MISNLPTYIPAAFALTTLATALLCYKAIRRILNKSDKQHLAILFAMIVWLTVHGILALNNLYSANTTTIPPLIFVLGILPAMLVIVFLLVTKRGRGFIDRLPLLDLTYLHVVRIPVELVLFWLSINGAVPTLMTFEGRNFDIIAGITAPLIAYFGIKKGRLNKSVMLLWNFVCLALLINIVVNAFLAAPSPFQRFAFEQPNIAILYFPFSWLPTFVVPVVLFAHLVSLRQLLLSKKKYI